MRKTSFGLSALVAMAAAAAGSISGTAGQRPYRRHSVRSRAPWPPVEQSTRQQLRGQRRAQGGPGITLNTRTFQYEPRA